MNIPPAHRIFATLATLVLVLSSAQAATIYSETFSAPWEGVTNDGTDALHGTTPTVTVGTNTWTAFSDFQENGVISSGSGDAGAYLAFTPTSGLVYTLSVTVTEPSGGTNATNWAGLGFTADNVINSGVGIHESTNAASPWMLYRDNGAVVTFDGPGASGVTSTALDAYNGTQTMRIVLDTTASQWTAEWFMGATSVDTVTYTSGNPTISHVAIGRGVGSGITFSDFSLTSVPEPSAATLVALGGLALLRRRRK